MADFKQLDVLINEAGLSLDRVSQALGTFVGKGNATLLDAKPLIDSMIAHSGSLQAIQKFSTAAQNVIPKLPAGQVVVDVGAADDGDYTGRVDSAGLTDGNKAYIANHLGQFSDKWGQVFNAKVQFPAVMGDLANTPEDPITPDQYDLSTLTWVRVKPN